MKRVYIAIAALVALLSLGQAWSQVVTTKPFPEGAQTNNLTASSTFTTGSATATLTGAAGRFTYICGFVITSAGTTTPTSVTATITGTVSATMSFQYAFVSSGQGVLGVAFPGCITSSAQNTNIVVNVPAGGTGTSGAVNAWGYTN